MTLLLDSTVLIDVLRGKRNRRAQLRELALLGHTLGTSVINIAEVHAGLRPGEEEKTRKFLDDLVPYMVDQSIARKAGLLKNTLARSGRTFALPDMLIAATALHHGLVLATDNQKDFAAIPDLRLQPLNG